MNEDDAYHFLIERECDLIDELINTKEQPWKVIKAGKLKREWQYCARINQVHDKVIQEFEDICIDNVVKLLINSFIFSAQAVSAYEYFDGRFPESWTEVEFLEFIGEIDLCDPDGNCRYSDYANERLWSCAVDILVEPSYERKLWLIDNLLSVTHQSTDLAAWFVEGGRHTLDELRDWREDEHLYRQTCLQQAS